MAYTKTWGGIARDLARLFPDDNGGYRSGRAVRNWVRRQEHLGEFVVVRARVPRRLLDAAGMCPADVPGLVIESLNKEKN
ncbi:MAG: hypothetical protein GX458_23145 [Phyllobacteriaceae bacterium]|nr:hypothetical protein [Phyllobacteriaceae bacterium]